MAGGETLEVTDRGRPVAMLVPVRGDEWQDLLARGRVVPPTQDGDVLDEAPSDFGIVASSTLATIRQDER